MADWADLSLLQLFRLKGTGDAVVEAMSDDNAETNISIAESRLPASQWGDMHRLAVVLLALHGIGAGASGSGAGGPVTAEKRGDWSRSYGLPIGRADQAWLMSSSYGREFLSIQRSRAARLPFVAR